MAGYLVAIFVLDPKAGVLLEAARNSLNGWHAPLSAEEVGLLIVRPVEMLVLFLSIAQVSRHELVQELAAVLPAL